MKKSRTSETDKRKVQLCDDILSIWKKVAFGYYMTDGLKPINLETLNIQKIISECCAEFATPEKVDRFVKDYEYEISNVLNSLIKDLSVQNKTLNFSEWEIVDGIVKNAFDQTKALSNMSQSNFDAIRIAIYKSFSQEISAEVKQKDNLYSLAKLSALSVFENKVQTLEDLKTKINDAYNSAKETQQQIEGEQKQSNVQSIKMDEQQKTLDDLIEKNKTNQSQLQGLIQKTEERSQNVMNTSMTVLGIFVTVVVTVFGSLEIMNGIATIKDLDFCTFVFYLTFVFTSTINIVFLLLHTLSRISGKNIASHCKKYELDAAGTTSGEKSSGTSNEKPKCSDEIYSQCQSCKNKAKCRMLKQMWLKYPFVFYPDLILFLALGAIFIIILWQHGIIALPNFNFWHVIHQLL